MVRALLSTAVRRSALAAALVLTGLGSAAAEPARYVIDPSHLSVMWRADHIGFGDTIGMFLESGGEFVYDEATQTLSEARFTVQAASVFSNDERRDNHLRGKDFLLAEEHPEITFVMTSAEATGDTTGVVTGDLTLRGVTRPIEVQVTLNKTGDYPFGGAYVIGITAEAVVKRSDFGSTYAVENGWVGDEIPLVISFEAVRQDD